MSTRNKGGRPSKFTPATRRKILKLVGRGMPLTHAANVAGVSYQTFLNYRRDRPGFDEAIGNAIAKGIEARLKVIERATKSPDESIRLRSACWFLEHTAPEFFARNRVEVTGANGLPLAGAIAVYLPQKSGGGTIAPLIAATPRKELGNGN